MGGVGRLACQGFLVSEAWVGVLVRGSGFLLSSAVECPVMSFEMGLFVKCAFGQPVCLCSGLCSCVAGELVWYVLLWNLLVLGWCLGSGYVWRLLDGLSLVNVLCSQEFSGVLRFWA